MKHLRNILAGIGFLFVLASLMYAVQQQVDDDKQAAEEVPKKEKNVAETYQISAIDIPDDLNFSGEPVPMEDPEIME
ncbi:MAG: lytic transglycosylase domain-containing protein, partial [Bacteroidota bacterium]